MAPQITSSRNRSRRTSKTNPTSSSNRTARSRASTAQVSNSNQRTNTGSARVTRSGGNRPPNAAGTRDNIRATSPSRTGRSLPSTGGSSGNTVRAQTEAGWARDRGAKAQVARSTRAVQNVGRSIARMAGIDRQSVAERRLAEAAQGSRGEVVRTARSSAGALARRPSSAITRQGSSSSAIQRQGSSSSAIQRSPGGQTVDARIEPVRVRNVTPGQRALPGRPGLPGGTGGADSVRGSGVRTGRPGPSRVALPPARGGSSAAAGAPVNAAKTGGKLGRLLGPASLLIQAGYEVADLAEQLNPNSGFNRAMKNKIVSAAQRKAEAAVTRRRLDPNGPSNGRQGPAIPDRLALQPVQPRRRPNNSAPVQAADIRRPLTAPVAAQLQPMAAQLQPMAAQPQPMAAQSQPSVYAPQAGQAPRPNTPQPAAQPQPLPQPMAAQPQQMSSQYGGNDEPGRLGQNPGGYAMPNQKQSSNATDSSGIDLERRRAFLDAPDSMSGMRAVQELLKRRKLSISVSD